MPMGDLSTGYWMPQGGTLIWVDNATGSTTNASNYSSTNSSSNTLNMSDFGPGKIPIEAIPSVINQGYTIVGYTGQNGGSSSNNTVKIATSNLFIAGETPTAADVIEGLFLQDIGGQELINISRHDIINGQNFTYQPISNLGLVSNQYSTQNIVKLQNTSDAYFNSFPFILEDYLPSDSLGISVVDFDSTTGNIVISLVNLTKDKRVEVEFLPYTGIINDTIYP